MQGEGQEFESPRLHHSRGTAPAQGRTRQELKSSGPIPETTLGLTQNDVHDGSKAGPRAVVACRDPRAIEPLIRALPSGKVTDQRIAGTAAGSPATRGLRAAPYQLDMFGSKSKNLRFRRVKDHPDPNSCMLTAWSEAGGGQATKGTRWMPWRQEPMKDVAGCVKPRGVASRP